MLTPEEERTQTAFRDIPASSYPFTVEFFKVSDRTVVHSFIVAGPGAFRVPALAKEIGEPVGVRTTYADGTVQETVP